MRVEVWESESRPGGKIESSSQNGYVTEKGAAMLLNFRPDVSRFLADADLESTKQPRAEVDHRYVVSGSGLKEIPMKMGALLMSDVWSTRAKLRMLLEPFIAKGGHHDETVGQFVRRRLGPEVLDKAMGPYVAGIYASDPELANAKSVLPRLVALEQRYGSIAMGAFVHRVLRRKTATATEAFSFQGGMETLAQRLANAAGVCFRGEHTVTDLSRTRDGWRVVANTSTGERVVHAAQLVLSTPAYAAAELLREQSAELSTLLDGIEYASLNVVHTGYARGAIEHPLDGNGFLAQGLGGTPLIGSMWISSLFDRRAPAGRALLSNYVGGALYPDAATWSDARLLDATMTALRPLLGIRSDPEMVRIDRHRRAMPLYHGDYCRRMQHLKELLATQPGLYLAANYRDGIAVRDRLGAAMQTASIVIEKARAPASRRYSLPSLVLDRHSLRRSVSGGVSVE